jgi:enoyl-CoA hydratase
MDYTHLKFEEIDRVGILSINRPDALNAINQELMLELAQFLDDLSAKTHLRVLIVTGVGKAFIAGADIKAFQDMSPEEAYDFSELGKRVFNGFSSLDIPVIAAINGYALGGGLELALGCDIRVANEKTRLGLPECSLGLIPGFNGTQRLTRLIGLGNALYMMLLGEGISASDAYQIGLVQKLCAPETLMEEVMEMARKMTEKGPNALKRIKEVARKGLELSMKEASKMESKEFGRMFKSTNLERKEGISAFIEKRKPNW